MSTKKKRSYMLTDEADRILNDLAQKSGISKTAVLEIIIRKAEKESLDSSK